MLTGIDHLVIAVPDPDAAVAALERELGLRPGGGGRHEGLGTLNRLVWLGDTYLELIGIFDRALAERSWIGAPTVRALDGGGGLATWAVASGALDADAGALRARGVAIAASIPGERRRADGAVVRWRLAAPATLGPVESPFLIEHDPSGPEWTPVERAARAGERHPIGGSVRLEILELATPDPGATGLRLLRGAGIGPFRPSLSGRGARDAPVGPQTIRLRSASGLVAGPAWPIATIHLRVDGPVAPEIETRPERALLGCRFVVRGT